MLATFGHREPVAQSPDRPGLVELPDHELAAPYALQRPDPEPEAPVRNGKRASDLPVSLAPVGQQERELPSPIAVREDRLFDPFGWHLEQVEPDPAVAPVVADQALHLRQWEHA